MTHNVSFVKLSQQKMSTSKSQSNGSQGGIVTSQVNSSKFDYSVVAGKDRNKETSKTGPICKFVNNL